MAASKFKPITPTHIRIECGSGKLIHEIRRDEESGELIFNDFLVNQAPDETESSSATPKPKGKPKDIFDQL